MDPEELQRDISYLIEWFGPGGERLFNLAIAQERMFLFAKLRELIAQKDAAGDETAAAVLAWAWQALAE